jgi:hypothetical protein
MKMARAFVFGFVWAYFIFAIGVPPFSFKYFISFIPAVIIFRTIERLIFEERKAED